MAINLDHKREAALDEPLLGAAQAARLLSVRPAWIYAAVREGRLPHVRLGRQVRFLRADLEAFVAANHPEAGIATR
jgi:excisionase family DNA binding protein